MTAAAKRARQAPARGARTALLARLHIARKEMRLGEEDYRAVLLRVTARESAADCTDRQIADLLSEFRRLGWRPKHSFKPSANGQVRVIYAVWNSLRAQLDGKPGAAELRAFIRRMTRDAAHPNGVDAPEFCNPQQANRVIEGLKGWRENLRAAASKEEQDDAV